jgi:hypothetical protein
VETGFSAGSAGGGFKSVRIRTDLAIRQAFQHLSPSVSAKIIDQCHDKTYQYIDKTFDAYISITVTNMVGKSTSPIPDFV